MTTFVPDPLAALVGPAPDRPLVLVEDAGPLRLHGRHAPTAEATIARLGGRALARDVAGDLSVRAALLGHPRGVLCLAGAAWVHGAGHAPDDPPQPEHAPAPGRRDDDLARQMKLTDGEVMGLGGVLVTTPERTAWDLAHLHEDPVLWLRVLAAARTDLRPVLRRACSGGPVSNRRRAADALRAALAG